MAAQWKTRRYFIVIPVRRRHFPELGPFSGEPIAIFFDANQPPEGHDQACQVRFCR